jgi:hypothetical protein
MSNSEQIKRTSESEKSPPVPFKFWLSAEGDLPNLAANSLWLTPRSSRSALSFV